MLYKCEQARGSLNSKGNSGLAHTVWKFLKLSLVVLSILLYNSENLFAQNCTNIVSFGGNGNGSSDNLSAFSSALNSLPSAGGCIAFPAGKYYFSAAISTSFRSSLASLTLVGSGQDSTTLYWAGGGGLTVNYSSPGNSFHVRQLSFTTGTAGSGTALTLNQSSCLNSFEQSEIQSVNFRGDNNVGQQGSEFWGIGYLVNGVSGTSVDSVTIYGYGSSGGIGAQYQGTSSSCYSIYHNISKSIFNNLAEGVVYGSYTQGMTITQSNFQNGTTGFYVPPNAGESGAGLSQINISNNQFQESGNNILVQSNVSQISISGNDILVSNNTSGIYLQSTQGCNIVGNSISGIQTGAYGIALNNSVAGTICTITGNQFLSLQDGVWLQGASSGVNVQSNSYSNNQTNVLNSGASNTIGGSSP